MKKWIVLAAVCSLPIMLMAQDDDMYFVPTKENVAKEAENYGIPKNTYYSGSNRSVDDYNGRLSSSVTPIDSLGQEVESDDYKYTRQLSRFDDYSPSQAYWDGYRDGRWSSPRYYGRYGWYSTWYDPWYSSWYDPYYDSWYYGSYGYYGWSSPWRYGWYGGYYRPWGYYGWYTPVYYYGGHHYRPSAHRRFHANRNVGSSSAFGNGFGRSNGGTNRGGFGNSRSNNTRTSSSSTNRGFGGSRSNSTGFGSRSSSSSSSFGSNRSSSSSGGSFSGGRSGGGGGRSGGGGRFGR